MVLAITDMANPAAYRVVQRRRIDIRAEPAYLPRAESKVVFVTSLSLDRRVYEAWVGVLMALDLPFDMYSVSRYGHFDPALPVLADGNLLGDHLQVFSCIPIYVLQVSIFESPPITTPYNYTTTLLDAFLRSHVCLLHLLTAMDS